MSQSSPGTQIAEGTQLARVLTDLQVGIRKISMYGLSHSIVPKITQNLSGQLNHILEKADALPLVIGKNELLYQEASVAPGNAVIQELSQTLHRLNIIQVTFKKGLTEDAVLKFLTFILENRAKPFRRDNTLITQFHEETPSISLQWVTFKDAISQPGGEKGSAGSGNIWQNLLNHAGDSGLPEAVRRLIDANPDHPPNTEAFASAINALYAETGLKKESYETTVLEFLKRQGSAEEAGRSSVETDDAQNLGEIFAKLRTEVREQVFKLSMRVEDDQVMPLENFLSHMPLSLFPEVLKQMDLSADTIAPPAYRLLKKLAPLAKENDEIKRQLSDKLQGHESLRAELIPEKTKGESESPIRDFSKKVAYTEDKAFSETAVAHQLAWTLLEILEQPRLPKKQSEHCLKILKNLLIQGVGETTFEILMHTIRALLKNFGTKISAAKSFWRAQLKTMLCPEIVMQILKGQDTLQERDDAVISGLVSVAGDDLFRVTFHILEVEKHLSTRKQAIRFLIACGPAVIPAAVIQLKNPQWFVVRNMLVILKGVNATDEVLEVMPCIKHKAEQVRLAALQTLEAIAPETDLFLDALGTALRDSDESVSKTAISLLVASRHAKAAVLVSNLFLEAEQDGKWHLHQGLLLKEIEKNGSATWLPTLIKFRKGVFFMLFHWGRQRQIQNAIRKAISEIEKKGTA